MKPAVSIVIPCFNAAATVEECLDGVLNQAGVATEVVAVDDGSTDATAAILERYRSRIRVIGGPNEGAGAARQKGTNATSAEFVQYVDADDLLAPGTLARRVEDGCKADADVVYVDWQELNETDSGSFAKGPIHDSTLESVDADTEVATLTSFWAPPVALLYRRRLFQRMTGWRTDLPIVQDVRFLQDAAHAGARFFRSAHLGAYHRRWRTESLSRRSSESFARDVFRNACEVMDRWQTSNGLDPNRRRALGAVFDYCARELINLDDVVFRDCLERLYAAEPGFRPSAPKIAGVLGSFLGRRSAASLYGAYRRMRSTE